MRIIKEKDLERWADTLPGRAEFPRLVGDLIRATAGHVGSFRFPCDDAAQMHGFDGMLFAEEAPPYVPGGNSIWELGTGQKVPEKAEEDYQKRKKDTRGIDPKETVYVAAFLRCWEGGNRWANEKAKEGFWREVRVIDAVDLVDWLNTCEVVAMRLARELRLFPPTGLMSIDAFWDRYSKNFSPPLTEEVLLAGRSAQANELLNRLQSPSGTIRVQADSLDEVIAFAVAAIRTAPKNVKEFIEARAVVLCSEDAADTFVNRGNFVFLLQPGARTRGGQLASCAPTVVPRARDDRGMGEIILLERPLATDLTTALETMRLDRDEARRLARACGRSVTVLARLKPSGHPNRPEWEGRSELLPALLAGAWDQAREPDRHRLAELAGARADHDTVYRGIETKFTELARMSDPPVEREGTVWTVRAPIDAFLYLGHQVGEAELESLSRVVATVFGEHDPVLDLPVDERPYAGLRNQTLTHSAWLREGLAKSLLVMTQFHRQAGWNAQVEAVRFVDTLVGGLPGLRDSYRLIADLEGELSTLMEAAPRPLLEALEQLLQGDGERIRPIFQDKESGVFGPSSPHTGLLWALEVAAWNPRFLTRATLLLAGLARIDPGGKLGNRPIRSLAEIFLPWHPSTNAAVTERIAALDRLIAAEPEVGWNLLLTLLPGAKTFANGTAVPKYDDAGSSEREVLTYGTVYAAQDSVVDKAILLAGEDPDRWAELLPHWSRLRPEQRTKMLDALVHVSKNTLSFRGSRVWAGVRDVLTRYRAHREADWAIQENEFAVLSALVQDLEPEDVFTRISWLFNERWPELGLGRNRAEAIIEARKEAIACLLATKDVGAVLELAVQVEHPDLVAVAYCGVVASAEQAFRILCQAIPGNERLQPFAIALSRDGRQKFGAIWQEYFGKTWKAGGWTERQTAQLLSHWADEKSTWQFARSLAGGVWREYWATKPALYADMPADDMEFAIQAYLSVGRAAAAVRFLNGRWSQIRTESLLELLDRLVPELNSGSADTVSDLLRYDVQSLFDTLRSRSDVPPIEIARREYAHLPLFDHDSGKLTIHTLMAQDADFFVQILCHVFPPENIDARTEPDEAARIRAQLGYRLISDFKTLPGCEGGELDIGALTKWVDNVVDVASKFDRKSIALDQIGRVLAYSPLDADGHWPSDSVSKLVEQLASEKVEDGIYAERFNIRGTTVRGQFDGGQQERDLARVVQAAARARRSWPRMQSLLERIADGWIREGKREDVRARQDANRFD